MYEKIGGHSKLQCQMFPFGSITGLKLLFFISINCGTIVAKIKRIVRLYKC